MPGIVGALMCDGRNLPSTVDATLDRMAAAIAHRGLAARSVVRIGPLALVVPDAAVRHDDLWIVADGIACEHVAEAYREHGARAVVDHLAGRFAFVLWDRSCSRLVLGRDLLGLRPLFQTRVSDGPSSMLLFASELKALLVHPACPRELDWTEALAHQAMPRRTFPPTSFFRGVDPVAPGRATVVEVRTPGARPDPDVGRVRVPSMAPARTPLARIDPGRVAADKRSAEDVIRGFRELFVQVVDDALGGDVARTGLLLSGGIDSIAIAAIAARHTRVPTFTVLGQSTWGNGDARRAHEAAVRLGLAEHAVVFPPDAPLTPSDWRRVVWLCESPHAGPQHLYKSRLHRYAVHVRPDLTRMLNGEGSDELMGADFRNHGEERPDGTWDDYLADLAEKQRVDLHGLETLAIESWLGRPVQSRGALARASGRTLTTSPWVRRWMYTLPTLTQDVVWRDDRLAAGHGLASDTPYLDARLVDFVLAIPERLHGVLFWHKRMLREALVGLVPDALRLAPKTPFFAGVDARFTTRLLWDMLAANDFALVREATQDGNHPELAPGIVDALLADGAADPQRGAVTALLTLTNLGLLERMARDAAARPGSVMDTAPLAALGPWDEARVEDLLRGAAPALGPEVVLAFAPGVELVKRDDEAAAAPVWYVIVEDQVRFMLDEPDARPACEVLRRLDGRRPLGEVLADAHVGLADVQKHLDDTLAFGVVTIVA